jgi:hypothetical protein
MRATARYKALSLFDKLEQLQKRAQWQFFNSSEAEAVRLQEWTIPT